MESFDFKSLAINNKRVERKKRERERETVKGTHNDTSQFT